MTPACSYDVHLHGLSVRMSSIIEVKAAMLSMGAASSLTAVFTVAVSGEAPFRETGFNGRPLGGSHVDPLNTSPLIRILPGDRIPITVMTPADRSTCPSIQAGDINNTGNGSELAGLHCHCPMVTGLAERSRLGLPFRSFLVMGQLSPADDSRFFQANHSPV